MNFPTPLALFTNFKILSAAGVAKIMEPKWMASRLVSSTLESSSHVRAVFAVHRFHIANAGILFLSTNAKASVVCNLSSVEQNDKSTFSDFKTFFSISPKKS